LVLCQWDWFLRLRISCRASIPVFIFHGTPKSVVWHEAGSIQTGRPCLWRWAASIAILTPVRLPCHSTGSPWCGIGAMPNGCEGGAFRFPIVCRRALCLPMLGGKFDKNVQHTSRSSSVCTDAPLILHHSPFRCSRDR